MELGSLSLKKYAYSFRDDIEGYILRYELIKRPKAHESRKDDIWGQSINM